MTLRDKGIEWPKLGLDENWGQADQPEGTSRDEQNVRVMDPTTRRLTGAQRAGLAKHIGGSTGSGKVQDIGVIAKSNRSIDYAEAENGSNELHNSTAWREGTPDNSEARAIAVDDQANVYALNGSQGFVKFSADGKKIATVGVTLKDEKHVLRSITVDEYRNVFVAVSEGGDRKKATIWAWRPDLDSENELVYLPLWEIQPTAFVGDMVAQDNKLYVGLNQTDIEESVVAVYVNINTASPLLETHWEVPYPLRGLVVQESGAVVVCAPPHTNRWISPRSPNITRRLQGDTPQDYEDSGDINIWSWYDAGEVDEELDIRDETGGPRLQAWRNKARKSEGRRDFFVNFNGTAALTAPHYHRHGPLANRPGIYFGDGSTDELKNGMATLPSVTVRAEQADLQQSALPMYEGAEFCVMAVVTPVVKEEVHPLMGQSITDDLAQTDGQAREFGIFFNRQAQDIPDTRVPPTNPGEGIVSIRDEDNNSDLWYAGGGSLGNPAHAFYSEKTSAGPPTEKLEPVATLVTFFCNGNINKGSGNAKSIFRMNGVPVDRAESRPLESRLPTELGYYEDYATDKFFSGWVHEILVIDRYDRDDDASGCFSDHATGKAYQYPDIAHDTGSDTILEKLEASLMRKWGIGHHLDEGDSKYTLRGVTPSTFIHPYSDAAGALNQSETPWSGTTQSDPNQFDSDASVVVKYDSSTHRPLWIAPNLGGAGYGLALFPPNDDASTGQNVLCVGPQQTSPTADAYDFRKLYDKGDDVETTGAGTYQELLVTTASAQLSDYCRCAVDQDGNAYIPMVPTSSTNAATCWVRDADGALLIEYLTDATIADSQAAYAVAIPPAFPEYGSDLTTERAAKMFLGCTKDDIAESGADMGSVVRADLVTATHNTDTPRSIEVLVVNDGDIKFEDGASWTTVVTGGAGALAAASRFVSAATLLGKRYYTDGVSYKLYDPNAGAAGEVQDWTADEGEIPPYCTVLTSYRSRIVLFGDPNDAHNWHMSAKDKPSNWDKSPPRRSSNQAIDGNSPELAGRIPSIINAFAPINDDVALIGTDQSIYRLVGDPLAASGQIDLITRGIGIAYGEAWTQEPDGTMYVFLSQGGVMAFAPPYTHGVRISLNRIESRLQSVNFGTHYVKMRWNTQEDGLHVFVMPFAQTGGSIVDHYFWERRLNAWHVDQFNSQDLQPTTVEVLDGDAQDDRRLVIGCEDSYVRVFDKDAEDDDGTRIDAYATWLLSMPGHDRERRYMGFDVVLAKAQQGAHLGIAASNEPETPTVFDYRQLRAGRNPRDHRRVRGAYCFIRIGNSKAAERFAFEEAECRWADAGRKRVRSIQ